MPSLINPKFISQDMTTDTELANEATARINADNTLQTNINNEVNARTSADTTLQTNINNEASARIAGDSTLQTNLNNEITARGNADTTLQNNIDAEATTRANADSALNTRVTSLEATAPRVFKKASDSTNNSPTTFVTLSDIVVNCTAGKSYNFEFKIAYTSSVATTGISIQLSGTVGVTRIVAIAETMVATATNNFNLITALNSPVVFTTGVPTANGITILEVSGTLICSTSGTMNLGFRCETGSGTITVYGGASSLVYEEI